MTSVALPAVAARNPLRTLAWGGIVVGLVAAFVALPPISARSWIPSLLLALLAAFAGIFVFTRGERRFGMYAVAARVQNAPLVEEPLEEICGKWTLNIPRVIAAVTELGVPVPIVIRMEGTNVEKGKQMLKESGLNFETADDMNEAARKVVAAAKR